MRLSLLVSAALVAVTGCAYHPALVPVGGDRGSTAALTGHWLGEYRGVESGRTGSIVFTLHASGDSASGDVLMDEKAGAAGVHSTDNPAEHRAHASSPQMLFISFVGIRGGEVSGRLEPYVAPDCACTVTTTFVGHVVADTVEGTFFTEARTVIAQRGSWRVVRRP